eukprot:403374042
MPHDSKITQFFEIYNEITILALSYMLLPFSLDMFDENNTELRDQLGYFMSLLVGTNILGNYINLVASLVSSIYLKIKVKCQQRKQAKKVPQDNDVQILRKDTQFDNKNFQSFDDLMNSKDISLDKSFNQTERKIQSQNFMQNTSGQQYNTSIEKTQQNNLVHTFFLNELEVVNNKNAKQAEKKKQRYQKKKSKSFKNKKENIQNYDQNQLQATNNANQNLSPKSFNQSDMSETKLQENKEHDNSIGLDYLSSINQRLQNFDDLEVFSYHETGIDQIYKNFNLPQNNHFSYQGQGDIIIEQNDQPLFTSNSDYANQNDQIIEQNNIQEIQNINQIITGLKPLQSQDAVDEEEIFDVTRKQIRVNREYFKGNPNAQQFYQ